MDKDSIKELLKRKDEPGFFAKEVEIGFCDSNKFKQAKLSTIFKYAADIAGLAYGSKGYTHSWLWEHGFVFLLSRVSLEIEENLKTNHHYTLLTWERANKGVQWFRDFVFFDEDKNPVIHAKSAWVLANPHTRLILKPSEFTGKTDPHPEAEALCDDPARFKALDEKVLVGKRQIYFSDIDPNDHVDNAVYTSIAYDFLEDADREKALKKFCINFKKEAMLKDTLSIYRKDTQEGVRICGELEDGQISFDCEFGF